MAGVFAAIVTGLFLILATLIQKGRSENKRDHSSVQDHLDLVSSEIRKDIRDVNAKLSQHIIAPNHGKKKSITSKLIKSKLQKPNNSQGVD